MLPRLAKKSLGLLLMMSLVGCSLFTQRQLEDIRYMQAGNDLDVSADAIRQNLEKNKSNAGGFFDVYVMPLTAPYLEARREEIARLRGLSSEEQQNLEQEERELYLQGKSCFQLGVQIVRHREAIALQEWKASVVDHQGRFYELDWVKFGPAIEGRYQTPHGKVPQWILSAELCSRDKIDWERGFDLLLTPNFTPWPFPKSMDFEWVFEGTREERKKEKKSYKRYRGY